MKNLKAVFTTLLSSVAISFSLLCAAPVLVFFVILHPKAPNAIEQFVSVLTFGSHRHSKLSA